jgi:hypothetical protein
MSLTYTIQDYNHWKIQGSHINEFVGKLVLKSDIEVTDKIANFVNLKILELVGKDITVIPDAFFQHTNLQQIRLENTSIKILPEKIWQMAELKTLELEKNYSLKSLPEIKNRSTKMKYLLLQDGIFKTLPDTIDNLTNLEVLMCINMSLERLPDSIVNLRHLNTLLVDNNKLEFLPENIGNLILLKNFSATSNKLSFLPQSFYKLVNLEALFIENNFLNGPIEYANFPKLKYDYIRGIREQNEEILVKAPIRADQTALALLDARQKTIPYKASSAIIPRSMPSQISNADIQKLVKNPKFYQLPEDMVERILRDYLGYMPKQTARLYSNILSQSQENARNSVSNKTTKTLLLKGGIRRRSRKTRKSKTRRRNRK